MQYCKSSDRNITKWSGQISFVADLYGGAISDKAITKQSGILDKVEPEDTLSGSFHAKWYKNKNKLKSKFTDFLEIPYICLV